MQGLRLNAPGIHRKDRFMKQLSVQSVYSHADEIPSEDLSSSIRENVTFIHDTNLPESMRRKILSFTKGFFDRLSLI